MGEYNPEYVPCPVCHTTEHILEEVTSVDHLVEITCCNPAHRDWTISAYGRTKAEARRIWSTRPSDGKEPLYLRVWKLGLAESKIKAKKKIKNGSIIVDGVVVTNVNHEVIGTNIITKRRAPSYYGPRKEAQIS